VGAGFDSDIGGDVPDWDNTESRGSDEDAAWRALVARFEEPLTTTGPTPWPERENVPAPPPPRGTSGTPGGRGRHEAGGPQGPDESRGTDGPRGEAPRDTQGLHGTEGPRAPGGHRRTDGRLADGLRASDGPKDAGGPGSVPRTGGLGSPGGTAGAAGTREGRGIPGAQGDLPGGEARGVEGLRGFDDEGTRQAFGADRRPGAHEPDVIAAARRERRGAAHGTRARRIRARKVPPRPVPEDDEGHFVPPAPPPLPKLDSVAKGAWAALFGGPAYLVVATAAGWSVPGIVAFCAVAAFVTGFAILVLRMNEPGPGGPDDGDDGAVV
jgi:hypothetical protein